MNYKIILSLFIILFFNILSIKALEDHYTLEPLKTFQTCAYIADYKNSRLFSVGGDYQQPSIEIKFQNELKDGLFVDTLIISSNDLLKVKLDPSPIIKVCDETAINAKMCVYPTYDEEETDDNDNVDLEKRLKDTRVSLDRLIDENLFEIGFEHVMLNSQKLKETKDIFTFEVHKTSIYCIVFTLHDNRLEVSEDADDNKLTVIVDWKQSFGNLL
ncbi:hypothetical protein CANARDRAFT_24570 [[Candida] arabinofermentans NRRL YB-2248]|uniref:Autophagy-related protein 27 n=1 Tax=[Candida] arabinofermentans NRRL YB-2248 TaxID=983967 RepID=A0A1E4SWH1_9ASCO|nr:hypothetical protein CANARDRAFT_24570 [[Candida] arabinofermentans NRRL YB-2248]